MRDLRLTNAENDAGDGGDAVDADDRPRAAPPAVLLINHGSRAPHAAAFAAELATALRREVPDRLVAVGFLELNQPSPGEALARLALDGAARIQVVPLLFAPGHHYRVDIPDAVASVRAAHPALVVRIADPLLSGAEGDLIAALDARLDEATGAAGVGSGPAPDGLVLLAAGSSDETARAEVRELAYRWGKSRGLPSDVAFCDLSGDEVRAAVTGLAARGATHIACGALFLAAGRLLDAGRAAALEAGAGTVAGPLGMTPAMVDLVRRRCAPD